MPHFDLKPLTPEIIDELGLDVHALWQVKLGEECFGPFEALSLKHYARENAELLKSADLAHWEHNEWRPFFDVPEFKNLDSQSHHHHEDHFWILENGQKSAAQTLEQISQKIKDGKYNFHHEVSEDQGHTWKKLIHTEAFRGFFVSTRELPVAPLDSSFQQAKLKVMDAIDKKAQRPVAAKDVIPDLAYAAHAKDKRHTLNIDDLTLNEHNEVPVTKSFKWAAPGAASLLVICFLAGTLVSRQKANDPLESSLKESPKITSKPAPQTRRVPAVLPKPSASPRAVASVPAFERSEITQQPVYREDYPTQVETHQADDFGGEYGIDLRERESAENVTQGEPRVEDTPSLVDNQFPEEQTLDGAMNTISQAPPQNDPVIIDQPAPEAEYPNEYPAEQPVAE